MSDYPLDWKEHYLVFFSTNPDSTITSYSKPRPITRARQREGKLLNFYGISASKFGFRYPPLATKWGVFKLKDNTWSLCFSGNIPKEYGKVLIKLPDDRMAYMRRGKRNINFSISINSVPRLNQLLKTTTQEVKNE